MKINFHLTNAICYRDRFVARCYDSWCIISSRMFDKNQLRDIFAKSNYGKQLIFNPWSFVKSLKTTPSFTIQQFNRPIMLCIRTNISLNSSDKKKKRIFYIINFEPTNRYVELLLLGLGTHDLKLIKICMHYNRKNWEICY